MNILVTIPTKLGIHLSQVGKRKIEGLGTVEWNNSKEQFSAELLRENKRKRYLITGWGTVIFLNMYWKMQIS